MATPFIAGNNIVQGAICSLSSSGQALQGWGLQLSNPISTGPFVNNPIVLNMTGSVVVMLYNDTNWYGWAAYYDTTTSIVQVCV